MARILVVGAGALGSVFGGLLRCAGHNVTLLGRAPHLEAIAADGLRITGIWGEHRATDFELATSAAELGGGYDSILLTVKSYDTAAAIALVAGRLAPGGVVVSLQNGLGNVELIAARIGAERVLGGRVIFGATVSGPGRVKVTVYAAPVLIGAWSAGDRPAADAAAIAAAQGWAECFRVARIPSEYCDDIGAALWAKVFYNAALNPLGALLGVHYGALAEHEESRALMDRVIDEAFAVARAEGVHLSWPSAAAYREVFYARLVPPTFDHRSSMLQDLERGRRTEVEAINGEVWQRGVRHGIPTPVNELLTRLVLARTAVQGGRGSASR